MSSLTQSLGYNLEVECPSILSRLKKFLEGFFKSREATRPARVFHGSFSYELVPDTAINDFTGMAKVTSIATGGLYVCIFEEPYYQGQYQVLRPGETVELEGCGSIAASVEPIPINTFRNEARAPEWCWEISGPMYLFHFYSGYKYAS